MDEDSLILDLYRYGCVLVGEFKLSSGQWSPYYIDLRKIPSYPSLFDRITDIYIQKIKEMNYDFHGIVGIATAGIPLATLIAYKLKKPLIYVRKEAKGHGTRKNIEGIFENGSKLLIIDDVVTTGLSIYNAVLKIRDNQGIVERGIVLVDREQNGIEFLRSKGIHINAIIKVSYLFKILMENGYIDYGKYEEIMRYIIKKSSSFKHKTSLKKFNQLFKL